LSGIRAVAAVGRWGRKERRESGRASGEHAAGKGKRAAVVQACGGEQAAAFFFLSRNGPQNDVVLGAHFFFLAG